jgi:hypothetical protein
MIQKEKFGAESSCNAAKHVKSMGWISLGLSALILSGCAQVSSVQPGTPVAQVLKQYGNPDVICPSRDGGKRMVWTQQPQGETAYALHVSKQGVVGAPQQILTEQSFSILGNGEVWTRERVHCEFGPPANITRDDWGDDRQWIWSYRYLRGSSDAEIMYVYLGSLAMDVNLINSQLDISPQTQIIQWSLRLIGLLATISVSIYITRIAKRSLLQITKN